MENLVQTLYHVFEKCLHQYFIYAIPEQLKESSELYSHFLNICQVLSRCSFKDVELSLIPEENRINCQNDGNYSIKESGAKIMKLQHELKNPVQK